MTSLRPITRHATALSAVALLTFASCVFVHDKGDRHDAGHSTGSGAVAKATIDSKSGSTLAGKAKFSERPGGVLVEIAVHDAPPGWHAVHVHEQGDCSADDGTSAGGHFNPGGLAHGAPHAMEHHAGDLGNMFVDDDGNGYHAILMPELTVAPGDHSVVGRAIIVHAGVDDLTSQPTGAAGGRIGCGVIH